VEHLSRLARGLGAGVAEARRRTRAWALLGDARRAAHAGAHAEAVRLARAAVALDPGWPEPHLHLGYALGRAGEPDAARRAWSDGAALAPADARFPAALGGLELGAGRYPEAEVALRRALDLDPDPPHYLSDLGFAVGRQKRFDEATRLLDRARARGLDEPWLLAGLGEFLVEQARFAEAERVLAEAVARDPALAVARYWMGIALMGMERWAEALAALRTACELDPLDTRATAHRDQLQAALDPGHGG
jgi:Flp pilus assembly protein TadD